jgi:hypothetical protein
LGLLLLRSDESVKTENISARKSHGLVGNCAIPIPSTTAESDIEITTNIHMPKTSTITGDIHSIKVQSVHFPGGKSLNSAWLLIGVIKLSRKQIFVIAAVNGKEERG